MRHAVFFLATYLVLAGAGAQSPTTEPATEPTTVPATQPSRRLGIRIEDLSNRPDGEDEIWLLGGNLMIRVVMEDSRAEQMGIRPGDIIKRINGKEMKTREDVLQEIRSSETVTLDLMRKGKPIKLTEPTTRP